MTLWLGGITLVAGLLLLVSSRRERATLPRWFGSLPFGIVFLGLGTMLLSVPGTRYSLLSAACSLVAIGILGSVVWRILRRR